MSEGPFGCARQDGRVVLPLPRNLIDDTASSGNDERRAWLEALPGTIAELQQRWSLRLGEPYQPGGVTAWVAPAETGDRADLVLKVAWRHYEAEHEADGLRARRGDGAVRLHAAEVLDNTIALLLERCVPGLTLRSRAEPDQDVVIASLLPRLWRASPEGHPFRPLQRLCNDWADAFERSPRRDGGLDPGLAREGIRLYRSLPSSADRQVLLCTDLHAGNVLEAQREPWLMIDPKPHVGDPTYDALQHLLNCDRLHADPRALAKHMAHLLGLDANRLLLWLFARCVQESAEFPSLGEVARTIAPR